MGVSRVDYGGETLVDLTSDTVNEKSLLEGYCAHNKAGELIKGLAVIPTKVSQLENDSNFLTNTGDSSNTIVTFEQATQRANVQSGDDLATAFAKISKYCEDLKTVSFTGKYSDLSDRLTLTNNDLATVPGTAWDAVRGAEVRKDVDTVTHMVECVSPNSKEEVLALINNSVNLFQKSSMIPFRLQTSDKKLGENIANGNYIGLLEYNNGNVTGFLTNHWNPAQRISIAATLYGNPQQIFIKFENFEFFYDSITQINSDLQASKVKILRKWYNMADIPWVVSGMGKFTYRLNDLPRYNYISAFVGDWQHLRPEDIITLALLENNTLPQLLSNTNALSSQCKIQVVLAYIG